MNKEKLIEDMEELFLIIKDAYYAFDIWLMVSRDGRREYAEVLIQYSDFFEPVAKSALTLMGVSLYKIYETKDDRLSFNTILKEVEKFGIIDFSFKEKLECKMKRAKLLWRKVKILRSCFLAHRSYNLTIREICGMANITPNQIKRMIKLSVKIFNALWVKLGKAPKKTDEYTAMYTSRILGILKRELPRNPGSGVAR